MLSALEFTLDGEDGRARATTLKLPHGPVHTPVFMPVGTKGAVRVIYICGLPIISCRSKE